MYKLSGSFFCFLNSSKDQSSASDAVEKTTVAKSRVILLHVYFLNYLGVCIVLQ